MKTKRRHELQTNKLADWLGNHIQSLKPYSNYILTGAIGVVVIFAFVMYMSASQKARASQAWSAYFSAVNEQSPDALMSVPKSHPNTVASLWALQSAGDVQIREGTRLLYMEREEGIKSLEAAQQNFEKVVKNPKTPAMLRYRSQYALAQTLETLGKLDEAKQWYGKIPPNTAIGNMAAEDLRRLEDSDTAKLYDALASYKPPDMSSDRTFEPEDPLADFPDVPKRPDLSFPGDEDFMTDGTDGDDPKGSTKSSTDDNTFDTTKADTKKTDDDVPKEADKKPMDEDKKQPTEKPADEDSSDAKKKSDKSE